jgi:hypothetical protein
MKTLNEHLDPPRYPKLILPLEDDMKKSFDITVKKVMIDVTKQLTKEIKSK